VLGTTLTVTGDETFNSVMQRVTELLAQRFGNRAKFDLSLDDVFMASGDSQYAVSFTLTVYLDGAESQALTDEAP
jgi:hypothetical protein